MDKTTKTARRDWALKQDLWPEVKHLVKLSWPDILAQIKDAKLK